MKRRALTGLAAAALAAIVVIGLVSAGGDGGGDGGGDTAGPALDAQLAAVEGAPPPLAALYERANELIGGEARAFKERLASLEGYPVVVNKWASWCGPCRAEFPFLQSQVAKRGTEVAFIGVNSADNDGDARRFLEEFPLAFPSYRDPDSKVAEVFNGVAAFPTTAFYDSDGELAYVKQGGYATEAKLAEDIERYAK